MRLLHTRSLLFLSLFLVVFLSYFLLGVGGPGSENYVLGVENVFGTHLMNRTILNFRESSSAAFGAPQATQARLISPRYAFKFSFLSQV